MPLNKETKPFLDLKHFSLDLNKSDSKFERRYLVSCLEDRKLLIQIICTLLKAHHLTFII